MSKAGYMDQWSSLFTDLAEDWGSAPSTHIGSSQLPKTFVLGVFMVFSEHYRNIIICGALINNHIYA